MKGIWIVGDQLIEDNPLIQNSPRAPLIMIEYTGFSLSRTYHKKKLILVWSAMRHYAEKLRKRGADLTYIKAAEMEKPLNKWIKNKEIDELHISELANIHLKKDIEKLNLNCKIVFLPDNQFMWQAQEFRDWAYSRKKILMEDFYRTGRKKYDILIEKDGKPSGGKWNLDRENRKPPPKDGFQEEPPQHIKFPPDKITKEVIAEVERSKYPTYGKGKDFNLAVTHEDAKKALDFFIEEKLANFGSYQDIMLTGDNVLWHSILSPYLNLGLLHPLNVVKKAELAYYQKNLPLNSVEGFIRQILGWREYMHCIYNYKGGKYLKNNWFNHERELPTIYWYPERTAMNCMASVIEEVRDTGYAHHIQRLMVLSNFALLAEINPLEVKNWFHTAFIDAYDWVMQPNVIGMGQFADGGIIATKPYISSANYINKMSDYCRNCAYNHNQRTGVDACPFNYLYWAFLHKNNEKLRNIARMKLILKNLDRIDKKELKQILAQADDFLKSLK